MRKDLIWSRISEIRASVNRLALFKKDGLDAFFSTRDNFAIAEHHLRKALEASLDIARHILAKKAKKRPSDYTECFDLLGQERIVPYDFSQNIKKMGGYRNRLVHLYWEVSAKEIYEIISTRLEDFELFCKYIVDYTEKEQG